MTETTALDAAHAAMQADPRNDAARLRFFERLADSELFLMLTEEAKDENISPELFDVADGRYVLAFDREERLAQFAGRPVPYVALSGRVLSGMLAGQVIGLGLNLETAPSSMLVPAEALEWLAETLQHDTQEVEEKLAEFMPPSGLPDTLLTALDAKLATAGGLARAAYLVATKSEAGAQGHMLGFVDAVDGAEAALAKAASEALTFSGIEAGAMDVGFFAASAPTAALLAKVGLRFDLPQPQVAEPMREAPGSNPDNPPILK
ncbi:SseB family protein [Ruegeria sp. HKCCD7318]|uniref:SseB family protein n=1 Tax=Ruegeria sp. HKCCD7318 TaxID=2683014 RepID=UPI001492CBA3|nr:SseB family protein [Ruegeria sp. HKCCD7318]NOE32364.1 SseB family protein [Ruegeria sp. HKCCD7318]